MSGNHRDCAGLCGRASLPLEEFSRTQWRKNSGTSRCKACVGNPTINEADATTGTTDHPDLSLKRKDLERGHNIKQKKQRKQNKRRNFISWFDSFSKELERDNPEELAVGEDEEDENYAFMGLLEELRTVAVDWDQLELAVYRHPEQAKTALYAGDWMHDSCAWNEDAKPYPLHYILERRPPLSIVKVMLQAFPDALLQPSGENRTHLTPIGIACHFDASPWVINYLVRASVSAHQEYFSTPDGFGLQQNPLNFLIHKDSRRNRRGEMSSFYTFQYGMDALSLYREYQVGCNEKFNPLHFFLHYLTRGPSDSNINWIELGWVSRILESLVSQEDCGSGGQSVLFVLLDEIWPVRLSSSTASQIIKRLLNIPSITAKEVNDAGRLPLHLAVVHQWPISCIECLLEAHPGALGVRDPVTGLLPFQLAGDWDVFYNIDPTIAGRDRHSRRLRMSEISFQRRMSGLGQIRMSGGLGAPEEKLLEEKLLKRGLSNAYTLLRQDPSLVQHPFD
jgi:hypothetical protein